MAIQTPLAQPLFSAIDNAAIGFYQSASAIVSQAVGQPFRIFLTLYILIWGFSHWRGMINEPVGDFVARVVKIAFIAAIALNSATYLIATANWIYDTPQRLIDLVAPAVTQRLGTNAGPAQAVDLVIAQASVASGRFISAIGGMATLDVIGTATLVLSGIAMEVFSVVLLGIVIAVMIIAKIVLAVMLALGPLFIAFLLFQSTRALFNAWMGQVLAAMFTYVIAGVVMLIGLTAVKLQLDAGLAATDGGVIPSVTHFSGYVFVMIVILLVTLQVPAIGAALGNGVQVSTMGATTSARRLANSVLRRVDPQSQAGRQAAASARLSPAARLYQRLRPANKVTKQ